MPTPYASRIAALGAALAFVSACSTTQEPTTSVPEPQGTEAEYCPPVAMREGTAILRRGEADAQEFVASIAETTRSCRVVNGQLVIEVGVAGRLVPGAAARPGTAQLPIRVAVTRGDEVLYSNLGGQNVAVTPGAGAQSFVYVDRGVRLVEPATRTVSIQVGFDEQR